MAKSKSKSATAVVKSKTNKIAGVGDIVKKVTDFVGIKPCEGCAERQKLWNTIFPIRLRPRELTEEELKKWKDQRVNFSLKINNEQRLYICRTYSEVFQVPYYEPCVGCSPAPIITMIERLDKITETYK
jgi:hypothetical protein